MSAFAIPGPKDQVLPQAENLFKALLLLVLLFVSFYGCEQVVAAVGASTLPPAAGFVLKWSLIGLLAVFNVVLLTAMGILAHDAVHRVLFKSPFWNEFCGGLLSAFALIPFNANRQFHLTHHSYAHQPGLDPENAQHHHSFLYAATAGSAIALNSQYVLLLKNLGRLGNRTHAIRMLRDLACLGFVFAIYFGVLPALGMPVWHTVLPIVVVFPLVFAFRALSDHYGIPAVVSSSGARRDVFDVSDAETDADAEADTGSVVRQRDVTGWVVLTSPWLEWLWSHVNYHEVHHKYPWLSHQHLPAVFAATRDQHPYLVVRGYGRSLLNLRKLKYYAEPEEVSAFRFGASR